MSTSPSGTAVVLQFADHPALDFKSIVGAFNRKLCQGGPGRGRLTWDCDDIAILDRGAIRIALGWVSPNARKNCWYVVIAIGLSPDAAGAEVEEEAWIALADRIVAETETYLPFDGVYRRRIDQPIDTDLVDLISELVLASGEAEHPSRPINITRRCVDRAPSCAPYANVVHRKPTEDDRMSQLRSILTEIEPQKAISLPMHATLYTFSLSLMLQVPSVGAALLVYNFLREDFLNLV